MGKTVIPGIIDAHNHIVLVGNRPGWHTALEHVFTIPDAIAALKARSRAVPSGEFITTVGPISEVGRAHEKFVTAMPIFTAFLRTVLAPSLRRIISSRTTIIPLAG